MASPSLLLAPSAPARLSRAPRPPQELSSFLARFGLSFESLLTSGSSNAKLAKGSGLAFSSILHLLPAKGLARAVSPASHASVIRSELPGLRSLAEREGLLEKALLFEACGFRSDACSDLCLAFSGHGGISLGVASCRARRGLALLADRSLFVRCLLWASGFSFRKALRRGLPFAERLNGTQELPFFHRSFAAFIAEEEAEALSRLFLAPIPSGSLTIPQALASVPSLALYDYAKAPLEGAFGLLAMRQAGIHTTASLAADREGGASRALDAIGAGFPLAVPFLIKKGEPLPQELLLSDGSREARLFCIDGDLSDLRMLDPAPPSGFSGLCVGLRLKKSRGASAASAARFALAPSSEPQALAGGGSALLRF